MGFNMCLSFLIQTESKLNQKIKEVTDAKAQADK